MTPTRRSFGHRIARLRAFVRASLACAGVLLLSGCNTVLQNGAVARFMEPEPIRVLAAGPPNAVPGTCWGREQTPAIIETETYQVLIQPARIASDGAVLEPPIYKTDTRQRIVRERRELWFEALCDSQFTPEFVASLQRALAVRGLYAGPVTGSVDARTRNAIRSYQKAQGLDSAVLSLAAARQLGLVTIDRPEGLARPNG